MDALNGVENAAVLLRNRFRHITCVVVQIYKLEGSSWREMTKDFVLLHMYYDEEDREAKLIAIDGIKVLKSLQLVVRGFVLTSNLQLVRPTKKFVHFISSKHGRSEMYGFGFHQVSEVEKFLRLFSSVHRRLHLSSRSAIQSRLEWNKKRFSMSSTKPQLSSPISLSTGSTPNKDINTDGTSFSSMEDSSCQEQKSQANTDVQHVEKGVQDLSFTSDVSLMTPNFCTSIIKKTPYQSVQSSVNAKNNPECDNPATLNFDRDTTRSVEQKLYELWSKPPWNDILDQKAYDNYDNVTSTWDSLFKH